MPHQGSDEVLVDPDVVVQQDDHILGPGRDEIIVGEEHFVRSRRDELEFGAVRRRPFAVRFRAPIVQNDDRALLPPLLEGNAQRRHELFQKRNAVVVEDRNADGGIAHGCSKRNDIFLRQ